MPRRSSGRSGGYGGRSGGFGRSGGYSGGRSYSTSRSPGNSSGSNYRSSTGYASRPISNPYTSQVQSRSLGGMGLGSMVATGMAIGGGSALGHHIVGNMLGGHGHAQYYANEPVMSQPTQPIQTAENQQAIQSEGHTTQKPIENPCTDYNFKFIECLRENQDNISRCQNMFDDMISCEKSLKNI